MASHSLSLFDAIAKRMSWLGQRQDVLAKNIANADTPDYAAKDLDEGAFRRVLAGASRSLGPVRPVATHPGHIARPPAGAEARPAEVIEAADEASPSGNAVVLEEQLMKVARTQMDYQTMTNLYRKHMSMFRTALRGGGN